MSARCASAGRARRAMPRPANSEYLALQQYAVRFCTDVTEFSLITLRIFVLRWPEWWTDGVIGGG